MSIVVGERPSGTQAGRKRSRATSECLSASQEAQNQRQLGVSDAVTELSRSAFFSASCSVQEGGCFGVLPEIIHTTSTVAWPAPYPYTRARPGHGRGVGYRHMRVSQDDEARAQNRCSEC